MQNLQLKMNKRWKELAVYWGIVLSALLSSLIFPEIALASKFDIDAGVKAATDPLIKAIDDLPAFGGKLLLMSCGGVFFAREKSHNWNKN